MTGYAVRRGPDPEVGSLERVTLASPEGLEVAFVPGAGMVGTSMALDGVELLARRGGLPAYLATGSTYGIPLLAPWANRVAQPRQEAAGVVWEVVPGAVGVHLDEWGQPIHGLMPGLSWDVEDVVASGDAAVLVASLDFDGRLDRFASFPFEHRLRVEAAVRGRVLRVTTSLTATGSTAVPVAFGWHPWLDFPGVPRAEWDLDLPFTRRAVLGPTSIPTGEVRDDPVPVGPLGGLALDDVYVDLADGTTGTVRGGEHAVAFRYVEGYPVGVAFAPLDQDVVCVEPMTAPTDPFAGRFPLRTAAPGETVTAVFEMTAIRLRG
ncbi:MAG: aldose 1-epimerase [Frankiales bacterium]|nr:aldose 1-epimerase [Frankiales bacterium]